MLNRLSNPAFVTVATPSNDALKLLRRILENTPCPVVAEIGVGIGATSYELAKLLNGSGRLELFDYDQALDILKKELDEEGFDNIDYYPNSRKTFDSYNWSLVKRYKNNYQSCSQGLYDFVYLDGAHAFQHDAPAAIMLKALLKLGGYLLFDDFSWTFAKSPTMNPSINKSTGDNYSEEQLNIPHVALVCELFFDTDPNFELVDLGYTDEKELRRAYRKIGLSDFRRFELI